MNNKKKLIELFIYVAIVITGVILLITSSAGDKSYNKIINTGGTLYAAVSDK